MKKASSMIAVLAMVVSSMVSCRGELPQLEPAACSFTIDVSQTGRVVPNLVSNVNVWDMYGRYIDPEVTATENIFDFVEYIQLMTATGGSPSRDLLKDPMDKSVKDDYDFSNLIANCRGILSLGARPHLKLGNVPGKFSSKYHADVFGVNVYPPEDYNEYYTYLRAIIEALVAEFGLEEVRAWHFGVFTEYENHDWFQGGDGTAETAAEDFCKIYDWSVQAVTDVLGKDVWIGAHSMTVADGFWDEGIFIEHCANGTNWANGGKGTHISYLSSSFYDFKPGVLSRRTLYDCISYLKSTAEGCGLTGLQFGVDEGRILCSAPGKADAAILSRSVGYTYMAAYDARLYGQMLDAGGHYLSSWEFLSTDHCQGNPGVSCHVARGINGLAGMKLVSVTADEGHPQGAQDIGEASEGQPEGQWDSSFFTEVKAYAAVDSVSGKIGIMVYSYGNSLDYDSTVVARLNVRTGLRAGKHRVRICKVDDECNWFDEWVADRKELGITDEMFAWSPDDGCSVPGNIIDSTARAKYLELEQKYAQCSVLTPEESKVRVGRDGLAVIDCKLAPNAVWFVEIF